MKWCQMMDAMRRAARVAAVLGGVAIASVAGAQKGVWTAHAAEWARAQGGQPGALALAEALDNLEANPVGLEAAERRALVADGADAARADALKAAVEAHAEVLRLAYRAMDSPGLALPVPTSFEDPVPDPDQVGALVELMLLDARADQYAGRAGTATTKATTALRLAGLFLGESRGESARGMLGPLQDATRVLESLLMRRTLTPEGARQIGSAVWQVERGMVGYGAYLARTLDWRLEFLAGMELTPAERAASEALNRRVVAELAKPLWEQGEVKAAAVLAELGLPAETKVIWPDDHREAVLEEAVAVARLRLCQVRAFTFTADMERAGAVVDPFDGQPMRRTELREPYSIGPDRVDDGGRVMYEPPAKGSVVAPGDLLLRP